ncbi:MAG TPA: hypothetical protein VKR41_09835 [Puia sp.]|nr:hypothetical protein [Puia sp.]
MKTDNKPIETMLVLAMACLAAYVLWHGKVLLWLSFGFGLAGILSPWMSRQIAQLWMGLTRVLGRISNAVLLSVVYWLVVVPVAVFRRMRNRDKLTYFDRAAASNFTRRDYTIEKEDLEKMW